MIIIYVSCYSDVVFAADLSPTTLYEPPLLPSADRTDSNSWYVKIWFNFM